MFMKTAVRRTSSYITTTDVAQALEATAIPSFVPRTTFPVSQDIKRAYYLGHHRSTLRQLSILRSSTDFYIDVRDYRIPLTSANPLLRRALTGLPRIIVYTKRDLGVLDSVRSKPASRSKDGNGPQTNHDPRKTESVLRHLHNSAGSQTQSFFLSATTPSPRISASLHTAIHEMTLSSTPHRDLSVRPATGLLVGMPNVGKSTLLNSLRTTIRSSTQNSKQLGKVAKTGDTPGITRSVSERTHITAFNPSTEDDENTVGAARIYARDTPGVFLPYITSPHEMLKLALTGCVSSAVVPLIVVADYLLFWMNLISPSIYTSPDASRKGMVLCPTPTNDIHTFLQQTAIRLGKLKKHAVPDEEGAAEWVLRRYREGLLGKFILDDIHDQTILEQYLGKEERADVWWNESNTNTRKI